MLWRTRMLSTVRAGRSFSGSVCITRWRTSCSTMARWANMIPRSITCSRLPASCTRSKSRTKNWRVAHDTVALISSSRPPGKVRYTVARETLASRAASSTVVLVSPQRATQA